MSSASSAAYNRVARNRRTGSEQHLRRHRDAPRLPPDPPPRRFLLERDAPSHRGRHFRPLAARSCVHDLGGIVSSTGDSNFGV